MSSDDGPTSVAVWIYTGEFHVMRTYKDSRYPVFVRRWGPIGSLSQCTVLDMMGERSLPWFTGLMIVKRSMGSEANGI